MDNSTILYVGVFCFAMMGLGMGLTVHEFKKMTPIPAKPKAIHTDPKPNDSTTARLLEMR